MRVACQSSPGLITFFFQSLCVARFDFSKAEFLHRRDTRHNFMNAPKTPANKFRVEQDKNYEKETF